MIGKEIVDEKPITNVEAKKIMESIEKKYKEKEKVVGYELEQSLKYAKKFSKIKEKELKEIKEKLKEFDLPEKVIVELINIMPKYEETIKAILHKKVEYDEELLNKIKEVFKAK